MTVEELWTLKELAQEAHAFLLPYDTLTHNRGWYERERGGVLPERYTHQLTEAKERLLQAAAKYTAPEAE